MGVNFKILYHHLVVKEDIPRLSTEWRRKIKHAIEEKLITHPELYGKPLRRSLKGYRKLRVGDYRVIFRIQGTTVIVFIIQHRSIVYKLLLRRFS
jgi:mRNA interferase RelE/StbE